MAYTFKKTNLKYKNRNGQYVPINGISAETSQQLADNFNQVVNTAKEEINTLTQSNILKIAEPTTLTNITAQPYNNEKTYNQGDYVIRASEITVSDPEASGTEEVEVEYKLYKLIEDHPIGYTGNLDSIMTEVNIGNEINNLKALIDDQSTLTKKLVGRIENIRIPIPIDTMKNGYIRNDGVIANTSDPLCYTDYVDVSNWYSIKYKRINITNTRHIYIAFYKSNLELSKVVSQNNLMSQTNFSYEDTFYQIEIPEDTKYVRFTTLTEDYGEFELYGVNLIAEKFSQINNKLEELKFIKPEIKVGGKNLYNPDAATVGIISNSSGFINTGENNIENYITSDYIPVKNEESITISKIKRFLAYDTEKNPITESYKNFSGNADYTYTPMQDGFIRASLFTVNAQSNMIVYGEILGDYEPYKTIIAVEDSVHLSETMKSEIYDITIKNTENNNNKKLIIAIENGEYTLVSRYGENTKLKRTLSYGKRNNKTFEFEQAYLIDNNGNEILIKDSRDDITPLRLGVYNQDQTESSKTVGANHGWLAYSVPIGQNNITEQDIGTTWKEEDGENEYILASIQEGNSNDIFAIFIVPAILENSKYKYTAKIIEKNLKLVSEDLNQDEREFIIKDNPTYEDAIPTTTSLYPSVNNRSHKLYADGVEITTDGIYYCDKFTVWEQYNIMDYAELGRYLQENIGCSTDDPNIPGCVRQTIQYIFGETNCLIVHSTEALKNIKYVDCGFLQAIPCSYNNKNFFRYGNGNNSITNPLFDQTNNSDEIKIQTSNLINQDIPMNRSVDLVKEYDNSLAWGFTTGFIPDISFSSNKSRENLGTFWSFRKQTKKSYPCVLKNYEAITGFYADVIGYRNYLRPGLDITNETQIEVGDALYIIIDSHTQQTNRCIKVPEKYIGKAIIEFEPVNFSLSSNIVGANGVVFSTTEEYGCAILKII